jgi:hypothetical protein
VDTSQACNGFSCLKTNGYTFEIARVYEQVGHNHYNNSTTTTITTTLFQLHKETATTTITTTTNNIRLWSPNETVAAGGPARRQRPQGHGKRLEGRLQRRGRVHLPVSPLAATHLPHR